MPLKRSIFFALCLTLSGAALAHQSVKNPAVKARMDGMVTINAAMKNLAQMAKGAAPYQQTTTDSAFKAIIEQSSKVPELFRSRQDDPVSEALPAIWSDFDVFSNKAKALQQAAEKASSAVTDQASLRSAMRAIGVTCKACHDSYRK
ncbi:cytochrome c [Cohaesibacter sp. CAU 1516]|uniref:c-type cytochrome n=1 Tax=Cohaesibacter sp. CAU 1516 TaxID=2576038 RepID=UPI0010FE5C63|nr:cytochrome c [Cohaesibacter sp. CAU 1516]TLP47223.1 cytochrome c [Cohaesibacter sp. CAU 1516]